jgi:WD repeat-containing protein 19
MKRLFKVGSDRHERGTVTFSWHPEGNFLASAGRNGIVHITDRHGDIIDEIPLSNAAPVLMLEWDRDGENLAILQEGNGVVPLWSLSSKRISPVETNLKDPSWLAWSKGGPHLAVGTIKGNLLIYNKSRKQKIPIVGKHSKKILCGAWSSDGSRLVLGSEDKSLSISNTEGESLIHTELKYTPLQTLFTRSTESAKSENLVSANLDGKSLLLYDYQNDKDDPMELTFAQREGGTGCRYGNIVHHFWYQHHISIVAFSGGYVLSVSTASHDLGTEKFCTRVHSETLHCCAYNPHLRRIATAGNDGIRVIDARDFKEVRTDFIPQEDVEDGRVVSLSWSPDGQILTAATAAGNVYNFLAKMTTLFATYKTKIGYLSSLREVTVVDAVTRGRPIDVQVKLEPSLIAIGADHVAAGMNNRVYFHRIENADNRDMDRDRDRSATAANDQEYVGVVKDIQLNATYASVLTDSKVMLHLIEPPPRSSSNQNVSKTFPDREEGSFSKITCMALTDNFLFYGTEAGTVEIFFLTEWTLLSGIELRLNNPIKKLYPNSVGTKVIIVDRANQIFLYDAVNTSGSNRGVTQFESAPTNIVQIMWDTKEKNVIMIFDGSATHTFVYIPTSMKGSMMVKLGPVTISSAGEITLRPDKVDIVSGNIPLISVGGELSCQTSAGGISTIMHPFFEQIEAQGGSQNAKRRSSRNHSNLDPREEKDQLANAFCQALALHKLERAWEVAVQLDKRSFYLALSSKAMELLDVEMAHRVYMQLEDPGMVMALRDCMHIEDKYLLAGQMALLFCDYQRAQDLFLQSARPIAALEMRKDLMQWDQALKLAHVLAPSQIPDICIQYGHQLEVRDDFSNALKMFDDALSALDGEGNRVIPDHLIPIAMMGLARCQLRMGEYRKGIRMANELDDHQLFIDCGRILERQKQYQEAASMFVKAEKFEQAASIYVKHLIKDKSRLSEAAVILEKVDNAGLNSDFGKACVAAGRFEDAIKAYRRASDWDKIVEIQLKHLDQIQQAFDIVRRSSSAQAAQTVAEYCVSQSDWRGAIEFCLIANKFDEAFRIAQTNNIIDVYTGFLGEAISTEDAQKVAQFYEKSGDFGNAGKFYAMCNQYARALRLFLQCGDKEIESAIAVVGRAQNENLTHQLIDFLVGEKDGVPKDPNYIYRLYHALKKYEDAAKTALVIARQEQDLGNYALAHKIVTEIIRCLEDASCKVSLQLRQAFVLLHSHSLVKLYVKRDDHMSAARLMLRVAQHISKFPMHVVNLLTLTVIECQRAGLKSSSYEFAVMLVRPENRASLDPNLKRKIEAIVRRKLQHGEGEIPDEMTACPISNQLIPQYSLECPTTRDALPMCIITGRHMVLDDWCFCPISKFPALYSEYIRYIQEEATRQHIATEQQLQGQDGSSGGNEFERAVLRALPADVLQSLSAPDPIHGKSVTMQDLVLVTPEEAMRYIQLYNNVLDEKKLKGDDDANNNVNEDSENNGIPNNERSNSNSKGKEEFEDSQSSHQVSNSSGKQRQSSSSSSRRSNEEEDNENLTAGNSSNRRISSGRTATSSRRNGGDEMATSTSPSSPPARRAEGVGGARSSSRSRSSTGEQGEFTEVKRSGRRSGRESDGIATENN